jgi:hypothetical protein
MQIEDYFDFLSPDDIRIKGHRIGIESVLNEFIQRKLKSLAASPAKNSTSTAEALPPSFCIRVT